MKKILSLFRQLFSGIYNFFKELFLRLTLGVPAFFNRLILFMIGLEAAALTIPESADFHFAFFGADWTLKGALHVIAWTGTLLSRLPVRNPDELKKKLKNDSPPDYTTFYQKK